MKTVVCTSPGVMEVNYMWLPCWLGMNSMLMEELNQHVAKSGVVGLPASEAEEKAHEVAVDFLVARYPRLKNLRQYLNSISEVTDDAQEPSKE